MVRTAHVAVLGGTFDRIHAGHRALFDAAFQSARSVAVGLTTDLYLRHHPKPLGRQIRPYVLRRKALLRFLRTHFPGRPYRIVPLNDRFGGSVEPSVDVLIVSEETLEGARAVNRERRHRKLPPLKVVVVPLRRADDLRPISSRRVRAGSIDLEGHRQRAILVSVRSDRPETLAALRRAITSVLAPLPVRWRIGTSRRSDGSTLIIRRASDGPGRLPKGTEYRVSLRSVTPQTAVLSGWDPEGLVGRVRGDLRGPEDVERLVRRLFKGRTKG